MRAGPEQRDRRRTLTVVVCTVAMIALAGCGAATTSSGTSSGSTSIGPQPTGSRPTSSNTSSPSSPDAPASAAGSSPAPVTSAAVSPPDGSLRPGETGARVLALQQKLQATGYWLGTPDGHYGILTEQAVLALQKAAGLNRDGIAGTRTLAALAAGTRPAAHQASSTHVEIDLASQLLLIIRDGRVQTILNTSTGSGRAYLQGGRQHVATTPAGSFHVFRQVNGTDVGPLGALYRPKYFNGGIAVHGYTSVPGYPASHGCVRVSNAAMDWIWSNGILPIGASVQVNA